MEISIKQTEGLGRRMTVAIPPSEIEKQIAARIQSLAATARIDGFRPGKAPLKVVQRQFGQRVREEISHDMVQRGFREAVVKEKLRPVGQPVIEHANFQPGGPLEFTASFEVYPEFEVQLPSNFTIEKPAVQVTDADVDRVIDRLREQNKVYKAVDRASQDGDQANVDFVGTLNGEKFSGGEAADYNIIIGSGSLVGDFEKQLTGVRPGESKGFDIEFPENYPAENLAGKTAHFDVKINSVSAPELPAVDEKFAELFGVTGGVESLRAQVKDNIARQVDDAVAQKVKDQVIERLLAANTIEVPKALLDNEVNARIARATQEMMRHGIPKEKVGLTREPFEGPARKSVAVGLLVAEILRRQSLSVTPQELRQAVEKRAETFEQPQQVVQWYYENRKALGDVEALLLEDKAIQWLASQAQIKETPSSVKELVEEPAKG